MMLSAASEESSHSLNSQKHRLKLPNLMSCKVCMRKKNHRRKLHFSPTLGTSASAHCLPQAGGLRACAVSPRAGLAAGLHSDVEVWKREVCMGMLQDVTGD